MNYQQGLSQFILHNNASSLGEIFQDGADVSVAQIYRNGFFRSCHQVLESTFPSALAIAGSPFFNALARAYIHESPPSCGTLTGYGETFPSWLESQDIDQNPLLWQLAYLDWMWITCLHGNDAKPLTGESFQALLGDDGSDDLPSISFIENAQLITSNEKAIHLWLQLKEGTSVENTSMKEATSSQVIMLWRPELAVLVRLLSLEEACYMKEILKCNNINSASENILELYPSFNLPEHFSNLLQSGLLSIISEKNHD